MEPRISITLVAVLLFVPSLLLAQRIPLAHAARAVGDRMEAGEVVSLDWSPADGVQVGTGGQTALPEVPPEKRIFEIGSISKVFTALLLAELREAGRLQLDTTLGEIYGESVEFADPDVAAITLGQLATHTSGLPRLPANLDTSANPDDPYAEYDRVALETALADQELPHPPPFEYDYSNFGAGILGDALSRLAGEPYEALLQARILAPLGLNDTVITLSEEQQGRLTEGHAGAETVSPWRFQALAGAGALHSTAHDLWLFGQALLAMHDTPFPEAIKVMLAEHDPASGIGLGIHRERIDDQPVYSHGGGTGGYRSLLEVWPEQDRVRIILMNNTRPDVGAVVKRARNEKARHHEADRVIAPEALDEYVGLYQLSPQAKFTIVRHKDHLRGQLTGQPFHRFFPHETDDRFFLKVVPAEFQFERDENGGIRGVVLHQNGREMKARRLDTPPPPRRFSTPAQLREYAGEYQMIGPRYVIELRGRTLFAKLGDQPFAPIFEVEPDTFEYDVVEARLKFHRNDAGAITHLVLHQNGQKMPAMRIIESPDSEGE